MNSFLKCSFLISVIAIPTFANAGLMVTNSKTYLHQISLDYGPLVQNQNNTTDNGIIDGIPQTVTTKQQAAFFGEGGTSINSFESGETRGFLQTWDGTTFEEYDNVGYTYSSRAGFSAEYQFGNSVSISSNENFVFGYSFGGFGNGFFPTTGVDAFSVVDENSQTELFNLSDLVQDNSFLLEQPDYFLFVTSTFIGAGTFINFQVTLKDGADPLDLTVDIFQDLKHSRTGDLSFASDQLGFNQRLIVSTDPDALVPEPSSYALVSGILVLSILWIRRKRSHSA